jgi:hypothetical protein
MAGWTTEGVKEIVTNESTEAVTDKLLLTSLSTSSNGC